MTHDDASVETGVGGQAKYDMMMVFCGNALHRQHNHQALDLRLHNIVCLDVFVYLLIR